MRAARTLSKAVTSALVTAAMAAAAFAADGPPLASDWNRDHASRTRLVAGTVNGPDGKPRVMAGIVIELDEGWKTYWRNPGSSGVPPRIEWTGSGNLAEAKLLFPAPRRFAERDGDTIGYKSAVVLPVSIAAADASRPVELKLALEYGVCKDVCIPVQPTLTLTLPPVDALPAASADLQAALDRVPRNDGAPGRTDPQLKEAKVALAGDKPAVELLIDFRDPARAGEGDVFLEAPDGLWIPLPKPAGPAAGSTRRFLVDLTDGADVSELKGQSIRVTMVAPAGQSEASFKLE